MSKCLCQFGWYENAELTKLEKEFETFKKTVLAELKEMRQLIASIKSNEITHPCD